MAQVEKTKAAKDPNYKPKPIMTHELPIELEYLWGWFDELFHGQPISFQELDAWSRITRRSLYPWEAKLIIRASK